MAEISLTEKQIVRFYGKTKRNDTTGCLEWTAHRNPDGYGRFGVGAGRVALAHRVAWTLAHGEIPEGVCVLHHCDNPPCVEAGPGHLFLGSQADNVADRDAKGRHKSASGERHGSRTHPERWQRGDIWHAHHRPEHLARGEHNGKAKLTTAQVRALRKDAAAGLPVGELARVYGVCRATLYRIISGHTWAHVDAPE